MVISLYYMSWFAFIDIVPTLIKKGTNGRFSLYIVNPAFLRNIPGRLTNYQNSYFPQANLALQHSSPQLAQTCHLGSLGREDQQGPALWQLCLCLPGTLLSQAFAFFSCWEPASQSGGGGRLWEAAQLAS